MKFYYIWAKIFSFELKKKKKKKLKDTLEIRDISLKNAIKMINIQKYYLVHIGSIQSNLFHLVLFSLFYPLKFYSVQFDRSSQSYSSVNFSSIQSVHIVSIWSTLVLFGPFSLLWSYSMHFVYFDSIWSYFDPHWSYSVHSVHFDPL